MTPPPAETVPPDPALPQLITALNPSAMAEVIQRSLWPERRVVVESCSVDRVRYRPETRAAVQYTIRGREGSTGEVANRVVTALLYPPHRVRRLWARLAGTGPTDPAPSLAFAPHLCVILQRFPHDRNLPSLPALMQPDAVTLPGHPLQGWEARPVRYRAGLGCALRWDHRQTSQRVYVKAYRDEQGSLTCRTLGALRADPAAALTEVLDVPEPIAYLAEHRALVQWAAPGRSLADIVRRDPDPEPVVTRVAEALAEWHSGSPGPALRRTEAEEVGHVWRAAAIVAQVRPSVADTVGEVMARIADEPPDVEPARTHGDLKPDHVLVRPEGLALLDLDRFAFGDPVADVASMMATLTSMGVREPSGAGRLSADGAFQEAYFARAPSARRPGLGLRLAAALLHEAAGCFRRQVAGWPEMMEVLVGRARISAGRLVSRT